MTRRPTDFSRAPRGSPIKSDQERNGIRSASRNSGRTLSRQLAAVFEARPASHCMVESFWISATQASPNQGGSELLHSIFGGGKCDEFFFICSGEDRWLRSC
jgi:hypothetical protein